MAGSVGICRSLAGQRRLLQPEAGAHDSFVESPFQQLAGRKLHQVLGDVDATGLELEHFHGLALLAGAEDEPDGPLLRLLNGVRAKVNLIPINPDPVLGPRMVPPDDETIDRFRDRLRQKGLIATVRRRRGDDVSAACGQLRAFGRDPRGVRARTVSR